MLLLYWPHVPIAGAARRLPHPPQGQKKVIDSTEFKIDARFIVF